MIRIIILALSLLASPAVAQQDQQRVDDCKRLNIGCPAGGIADWQKGEQKRGGSGMGSHGYLGPRGGGQ